jgi:hypothetical protein
MIKTADVNIFMQESKLSRRLAVKLSELIERRRVIMESLYFTDKVDELFETRLIDLQKKVNVLSSEIRILQTSIS